MKLYSQRITKLNFLKAQNYYLVGGGLNMIFFAEKIKKILNKKVTVILSKSNAKEYYNGISLKKICQNRKLKLKIVGDFNHYIKNENISESVAFCFGPKWIFKEYTLEKFDYGMYNVNPIPLPLYMGGAHFTWQILNSEFRAGIYLQKITNQLDRGPILYSEKFFLNKKSKFPLNFFETYEPKIQNFLLKIIKKIKNNKSFKLIDMKKKYLDRIYFPRINSNINGFINWDWNIDDIIKFINAFSYPYPGAKTYCKKKIYFIKEAKVYNKKKHHPFCNGLILRKNKNLVVAHRDGTLIIEKIYNGKKKDIFKKVRQGDRFYTPYKILEKALIYRPKPQ